MGQETKNNRQAGQPIVGPKAELLKSWIADAECLNT